MTWDGAWSTRRTTSTSPSVLSVLTTETTGVEYLPLYLYVVYILMFDTILDVSSSCVTSPSFGVSRLDQTSSFLRRVFSLLTRLPRV